MLVGKYFPVFEHKVAMSQEDILGLFIVYVLFWEPLGATEYGWIYFLE